jgi:hypothetical protein
MAEQHGNRRLVYVKADDLELWRCRPLGSVNVLDLRDKRLGHFDGLVIDAQQDRPLYIVVRREDRRSSQWFLVPVGDAWFDQTERAIRIDVKPGTGEAPRFDPDEFEKMSLEEAASYELELLAKCCPEVGVHSDGTPDYSRLASFQCPTWLKPAAADRTVQSS